MVWLLSGAVVTAVAALAASVAAWVAERDERRHQAELARLEQQHRHLETLSDARYAALRHVVEQQLPALSQDAAVPPLPEAVADDAATELVGRSTAVLDDVRTGQLNKQTAVEEAVVALGRKVQSSAHRIQEEGARMVQRHPSDPDVLHTSMRVDHAAAQQARQAQTLAALCGEWPGQQWHQPLPLEDVVRAAAGRITAYQRIEVSGDSGMAVVPRTVEPLIHLVAELLANATQSSPPSTQVLVAARRVQRGAVIEIDDCGVGLDDNRLEQARRIASGRRPVGLAELGEIPQTGLPVVGSYVRRHDFRVDLTESVYGGLRAIVLVPGDQTETVAPTGRAAPGGPTLTQRPETRSPRAEGTPERSEAVTASRKDRADPRDDHKSPQGSEESPKLPQRRSRRNEAPPTTPVRWPQEHEATQTPEQAGQWMGSFLSAGGSRGTPGDGSARPSADTHDASEER
ncbi:signal transduction histidine kinase [Saccharopolyspora lacisalsi]|uniref:histidine kinase n=1 Tax=Halosaccharopolyspora lacisalsi TaxID=1000566 RepID=A0A839E4F0_9PSEU|nr:ATP-binding protein [Halosaccharopolyspora lacisalsi]MBA8827466.1 signal transduction histidine kinase [Halosaccharopolyspora lacisalsi]